MVNEKQTLVEILHPGASSAWQAHLVARLAARPNLRLRLSPLADPRPAPAGLDLLFAFERLFLRGETTAADPAALPALAGFDGEPDLVVDLTGRLDAEAVTAPVLTPACLGERPLDGALAALLDDRVPVLEITRREATSARVIARWPVAIEDRRNTLRGVSYVLGRLAHMIETAVAATIAGTEATLFRADPVGPGDLGGLAVARLFARSLDARIRRKLDRLARSRSDWRTVWRFRDPATAPCRPETDATPLRLLPDDGARFFADPFLWDGGDRTWLFLEEFPYATQKGILSLAEIRPDGTVTPPRPILEQDCHLSWPQIFAHDGAMWMVPETSGRRTVELWRATRFPDTWEKHAVLLADVDLADATLEKIGDRWWMFGTGRERWCSSWDALHVFHAPALEGPWTPLADAPVKVDVATSRPAGRLIRSGDAWLRPVQNSARDYGCGLALTRIDRLDEGGFAETVLRRFATPAPLTGLHTWNRAETAGRLVETFDVFVAADAYGAARRLGLGGADA